MPTQYFSRQVWTKVTRPNKLTRFNASDVKGFAIHWPGDSGTSISFPTLTQTCQRLEGERRFHTNPEPSGRGWLDIAYNFAVDQAGRVFELRGMSCWSAANGNPDVNSKWLAMTALINAGDTPTPELIQAIKDWRKEKFLPSYPSATAVVGHRNLNQTNCPGDKLYSLVQSGIFTKGVSAMATLDKEDYDNIASAILAKLANWNPPTKETVIVDNKEVPINYQTMFVRDHDALVEVKSTLDSIQAIIAKL